MKQPWVFKTYPWSSFRRISKTHNWNNQVLKTCWNIVNKDTTGDKTKLQATPLSKIPTNI